MCDCINLIDAKLKEADVNTKLDIPIVFSTSGGLSATRALIATAKRDKTNRKKPSLLFAACCPFCGQPYKKGDAPPPKPTAGEAAAERSLNEALDSGHSPSGRYEIPSKPRGLGSTVTSTCPPRPVPTFSDITPGTR